MQTTRTEERVQILSVFNDKWPVNFQAWFFKEADAPDINLKPWHVSRTSVGEGPAVKRMTSLSMRDLDQRGLFTQTERCRSEARTACHVSTRSGSGWSPRQKAWLVSWYSLRFWLYVLDRSRTEQAHSNTRSRDIPKLSFPKQQV